MSQIDLIKKIYLEQKDVTPARLMRALCEDYYYKGSKGRSKYNHMTLVKLLCDKKETKSDSKLEDKNEISPEFVSIINASLTHKDIKNTPFAELLKDFLACFPEYIDKFSPDIIEQVSPLPHFLMPITEKEVNMLMDAIESKIVSYRKKSIELLSQSQYLLSPVQQDIYIKRLIKLIYDNTYRPRYEIADVVIKALLQSHSAIAESKIDGIVDDLVKKSDDRNSDIRMMTCYTLGELGDIVAEKKQDAVIAALLKQLFDKNSDVSVAAIKAIGKLGNLIRGDKKNTVVQALLDCLYSNRSEIPAIAAESLGLLANIIPETEIAGVIDSITERLNHGTISETNRQKYFISLNLLANKIPELNYNTVRILILSKITSTNEGIKVEACKALGTLASIIPEDKSDNIINGLVYVLNHNTTSWQVVSAASKALGDARKHVSGQNEDAVLNALLPMIVDLDYSVKENAYSTLVLLKDRFSPQKMTEKVRQLLADLNHTDPTRRESAVRILGELRTLIPVDERETVIIGIMSKLNDTSGTIQVAAASALGKLAEIIPDKIRIQDIVVDHLVERLHDPVWNMRWASATSLGKLTVPISDSKKESVIDALLNKLNDDHHYVRTAAIASLAELARIILKNMQEAIIDGLIAKLADSDSSVMICAIRSLVKLQGMVLDEHKNTALIDVLLAKMKTVTNHNPILMAFRKLHRDFFKSNLESVILALLPTIETSHFTIIHLINQATPAEKNYLIYGLLAGKLSEATDPVIRLHLTDAIVKTSHERTLQFELSAKKIESPDLQNIIFKY